jgi:integrase
MSAALRITHPCRVAPPQRRTALLDTPRSLRGTTLAAGIGVEVVSKRLGHARISVTDDRYTHPDDEQQREAPDTCGRLLADGGGT